MDKFDPSAAIKQAKKVIAQKKQRSYKKRQSVLEPHRFEIFQMYQQGASLAVIQTHLGTVHKCPIHRTTIWRFLNDIKDM